MSTSNIIIAMEGIVVQVYRDTLGSLNEYYEEEPTPTLQGTETIILQDRQNIFMSQLLATVGGTLDETESLAMLATDTIIQEHDELRIGAVKYDVEKIIEITLQGTLIHYEARVKRRDEGP
jgi:hypothetical protein